MRWNITQKNQKVDSLTGSVELLNTCWMKGNDLQIEEMIFLRIFQRSLITRYSNLNISRRGVRSSHSRHLQFIWIRYVSQRFTFRCGCWLRNLVSLEARTDKKVFFMDLFLHVSNCGVPGCLERKYMYVLFHLIFSRAQCSN